MRIEPPPSLACAIGTTPAATNAAEPDDDAPAVWSGFHGLRTGPIRGCSADRAEAELRHLRLAERHKAGGQKGPREIAVGGHGARIPGIGALHRRHARDGDVVLDEGRHAVEVAAVAGASRGARPRAVERLVRQAVQRRVDGLGARDGGLDESAADTSPALSASTSPTASRSPRASSPKA